MAVATHQNCKIYLGVYDVSGDHNVVKCDDGANELRVDVFNNTAENTIPGLWTPKISGSGYMQFGSGLVSDALRTNLGQTNVPITISPVAGAAGDPAVFMLATESDYLPLGAKVGDAMPFSFNAQAQGFPSVNGNIFQARGATTITGTTGIIQLGAVGALQRLYASLHLIAMSGSASPSLAVTVKSATSVGFSSPTVRLTFSTKTAVGYDFMNSAVNLTTDQYWRVDYTITGTTPSFDFVVAVGIF